MQHAAGKLPADLSYRVTTRGKVLEVADDALESILLSVKHWQEIVLRRPLRFWRDVCHHAPILDLAAAGVEIVTLFAIQLACVGHQIDERRLGT